ncbi:MAG: helix-hairpin-helix domain-containing protein, partial [Bacteroidales bacterium]|nr:helix-hairpin-helix domain-containing protein [Bacteroidales bacterium]
MKNLTKIPGVGKSIASNLWHIDIKKVEDLKGQDPEVLY